MDSKTHAGRSRVEETDESFADLAKRPFAEIEARFGELLTSDVDKARRLFLFLKKDMMALTPVERARRDYLIGRYYEVKSDHARAIEWTRAALVAFEALERHEDMYRCKRVLMAVFLSSGQYDKARVYAEEILEDPKCSRAERAKVLINLGNLEHRVHRYRVALTHYRAALRIVKSDSRLEAVVRYNMGNVQVGLNRFSRAEINYQRALSLFQSQDVSLYQAYVLQALGYLYFILGQYFHAENQVARAREVYQSHGDQVGAALCDLDLFQFKIRLNRYEEALGEVEPLIDAFRKLELPYEIGLVQYHAVNAALAVDDEAFAETFLEGAIEIFKEIGNDFYLAQCTMLGGIFEWRAGDDEVALDYIREARDLFIKEKLREPELQCLIYLYRIERRILDARDYRRMRQLLSGPISHQVRTEALLLVSSYWYARGQIKRAIRSRFEAVMTIEETRASIESRDLRESFFGDKTEAYESLIEWLFHWRNPRASDLIFKVLELSRGRQMAERLSELEALPPVLNRKEPTLLEISKLELRLKQLERRRRAFSNTSDYTEAEMVSLLESYRNTMEDLKALKEQAGREEGLGIYFPIELTPVEMLKHLPEGHLIVSYFIGQSSIYRVELDHNGLRTFSFPLYNGFIGDLNRLHHLLANRIDGNERVTELITRFEPMLLPKKLRGNHTVIFIPHKNLQAFPFALLTREGRLLLETHEISLCPNLPTLYFCMKRKASPLGRPLFFFSDAAEDPAAPERSFLTELFPEAPVQRDLNHPDLIQQLSESDFIHFAGHCSFNSRKPEESHLQMAGGRLFLSQLKSLRLNRPFINLASCQSGSVVLRAGNEPYGFVAGFFAGGATNILAGLWDLDDEATGAWMTCFYRHLHEGLGSAYRQACLTLREKHPNPYFWGGFCLLGKP